MLTGGGTALLTGDAGVGKSRLVGELTEQLETSGVRYVSGACLPTSTRLPLQPIVDALRDFAAVDGGVPFRTAIATCPEFVRADMARILPELGGSARPRLAQPWMLARLFTGLAQFWRVAHDAASLVLVIEDLHWADPFTRDFLTFLLAHRSPGTAPLLLTARSDQPNDDGTDWLPRLGLSDGVTRVALPAFSRDEVAQLVMAALGEVPSSLVDALWRRGEGNAFFTEQLLAAGSLHYGENLPVELAELLRSRVARTTPPERSVMELLAVASRPLHDAELSRGCGLAAAVLAESLRSLSAAALIRIGSGGIATRHALLGEAIVESLFPTQREGLHRTIAALLNERADPSLSAEIARHWQCAGRRAEELRARSAAAEWADRVGAPGEAAAAWERSYELAALDGQTGPIALEELALRAVASSEAAGDSARAEALAVRAIGDSRTGAALALAARLALLRANRDRTRGVREIEEAIAHLEVSGRPSVEIIEGHHRLYHLERGLGRRARALTQLDLAIRAGRELPPCGAFTRALASLAYEQMRSGDLSAGQASLAQARDLMPDEDAVSRAALDHLQVYVLVQRSLLDEAVRTGREAMDRVERSGLQSSFAGAMLAINLVWALLAAGRVDEAGLVIDPLTDGAVEVDSRVPHAFRSWVDVCRGRFVEAAERHRALADLAVDPGPETGTEFARMRAELAWWSRDATTASTVIAESLDALERLEEPVATANLVVLGVRVCADLAEAGGGRHRAHDATASLARDLTVVVAEEPALFRDQPLYATLPALDLEWRAECARLSRTDTVEGWVGVEQCWRALGWPHRAAYAGWRTAEAALRLGDRQRAASSLQGAWRAAEQHVPLRDRILRLGRLARIPVAPGPRPAPAGDSEEKRPWNLTAREVDVLRLLVEGLTNAQIGAELYVSAKTASVHVTAILRKLSATNRVHAAAIAERAGLF